VFGCRKEEIGLANDEASIEILNIVFFKVAMLRVWLKRGLWILNVWCSFTRCFFAIIAKNNVCNSL
jgi:hypothetical protein